MTLLTFLLTFFIRELFFAVWPFLCIIEFYLYHLPLITHKNVSRLYQKSSNRNSGKFVMIEKYWFRVFSYVSGSSLNFFKGISSCANTIYLKIHICSKFLRYQFRHVLNFHMYLVYFCIIYSVPCICNLVCQHYTVLIKDWFTKLKYLVRIVSPCSFFFPKDFTFFFFLLICIIPHKNY